jgi:NO-binding membrane sensor protein with MHYT domain
MGDGQKELQIAFSAGITALSFFVPIIVLMGAFLAVGTNSVVSRWRICAGGVLCGASVCGMHYLGNASIHNYTCEYRPSNVIGSAIIAVTASTAALSIFFVFRAMWANAWWKRMISALLLAGAVSGMHWCAAVGTRYRLRGLRPESEEPGNNTTLIVVICLVSLAKADVSDSYLTNSTTVRWGLHDYRKSRHVESKEHEQIRRTSTKDFACRSRFRPRWKNTGRS